MSEKRVPEHLAIILDGNGRWARRRGLPRLMGHRAGETVTYAAPTGKEIEAEIVDVTTV